MATSQVSNMRKINNRFKGSFFPVEMVELKMHIFDSLASDYDAWFEERDGYLEDVARVRGERKARRRMIELVRERVRDKRIDVYVLHSLARQKAEDFLEQIRGELNVGNSYIDDIGSSVSRYIGRGGLGIVYVSVEWSARKPYPQRGRYQLISKRKEGER